MRLLVDANLSPVVADQLRAAGFDVSHVADHEMWRSTDEEISAFATAESSAIISADSDFATMLALNGKRTPSLVLFRSADALSPTEQAALLVANLPTVEEELQGGAVVSISRSHLRVRRLPLQQ